jgi:hypothetical protein
MTNIPDKKRAKPNSEKCKSSVYARYEALQSGLRSIKNAAPELIEACESAAALAALEMPDLGITRLGSRNTLFKYADQVLTHKQMPAGESGWMLLNMLRKAVKAAAANNSGKRTKAARQERAKTLQSQTSDNLSAVRIAMTTQSKAYLWLLKEISGIAHGKSIEPATRQRLLNLLNHHDELFGHLFGPELAVEIRPENVTSIK